MKANKTSMRNLINQFFDQFSSSTFLHPFHCLIPEFIQLCAFGFVVGFRGRKIREILVKKPGNLIYKLSGSKRSIIAPSRLSRSSGSAQDASAYALCLFRKCLSFSHIVFLSSGERPVALNSSKPFSIKL